jgi:surface carbohydrate biosynthesis protein
MAVDILNLEFPNVDRDYHAITPLRLYLRKKYKLKIVTKNLFNPYFNIIKYNPKLILFSNPYGDESTFQLIKLLKKAGFYIVSLTAEGNTNDQRIETYIYGWNTDKVLYQDVAILWSDRFRGLLVDKYPELKEKLFVSGSTGFDRYAFLKFKNKEAFLAESGLDKKYKKVITICSSGVFKGLIDQRIQEVFVNDVFAKETMDTYADDLPLLQQIYLKLVRENPDILFILRLHPEFTNTVEFSEFRDLLDLPNAYLSKYNGNLPLVSDCVNIADINIGYESTTAMESWLLNKLTICLNPTRADFERETHYLGCLILKTYEQLQETINKYYNNEVIKEYEDLKPKREEILRDTIGHSDGANYKRAAAIIMQQLPKARRVSRFKMLKAFWRKDFIRRTFCYYLWQWDFYFKLRPGLTKPAYLYPLENDKVEKYEKIYSDISYE